MRRIAAHSIYWRRFYQMSYIELTDEGLFRGVFPLEGEIAGTEFYDGLLIPVNTDATVYLYRIHCNKLYVV
ncbi:MAG: hypothetical protein LBK45_00680 [Tannerellaceae bacterium]|nr:hypothetical protein [Tannerellaceae bacterium]